MNDSYFAVPNTLISANNPWVPIANPTNRPCYIHKGEVIGVLEDPAEFFETPVTLEHKEVLTGHAATIATMIKIQLSENEATRGPDSGHSQGDPIEQEDYRPKTAAMPDLTVYLSSQMESLIDVGSLPDHLKGKAWEMLQKCQKAFSFDGRLGHLQTKVHIHTKYRLQFQCMEAPLKNEE